MTWVDPEAYSDNVGVGGGWVEGGNAVFLIGVWGWVGLGAGSGGGVFGCMWWWCVWVCVWCVWGGGWWVGECMCGVLGEG